MLELVHARGILRSTKEIELERWRQPDGRWVWMLDICAYGEWWDETFDHKLDAYRYLKDRWHIDWAFWRALCRDARTFDPRDWAHLPHFA